MNSQSYRNCVFERILDHRENSCGKYQFLIKWKKAASSWQSLQNLESIYALVENYLTQNSKNMKNWRQKTIGNDQKALTQKLNQDNYEDQNTCATVREKSSLLPKYQNLNNGDLILRYDDFFQPQFLAPQERYKKKTTIAQQNYSWSRNNKSFQWNDIRKALQIKLDEKQQKYAVLVQFYDENKQKVWVDRDILRIANPFVLLDLYTRMQRCLYQNRQTDENSEIDQTNEQSHKISAHPDIKWTKLQAHRSAKLEQIVIEESFQQQISLIQLQ